MRNFWKHNQLLPFAVNLGNLTSLIPLFSLLKGSYVPTKVGLFLVHGSNWRALWKNRICSTAMKLRKSLLKTVMRQTPCNYIELFGSSAQDRHARRMLFSEQPPIYASYMTTSGGRTKQLYIIAGFLLRHWLYEWFSSAVNIHQYMRRAWRSRVDEQQHIKIGFGELAAVD